MARAQTFDYLHNMRFHVVANPTGTGTQVPLTQLPQAGFSQCSTPEATVEAVEYKEGQFLFTRKYPGHVTFNNVTMARGIAKADTTFWLWIDTVIRGTDEYRVELDIKHFHRADTLPGPSDPPAENLNLAVPSKIYRLYNAFPSRHKFSSDLDATDSAVSIMELEVAYEHCALLDSTGKVITA